MTTGVTIADLAALAAGHASGLRTATACHCLTLWSSIATTEPTPAIFDPKFYLLLQGGKRLSVGGKTILFTPGLYAVSSLGLPFTGQVTEASAEWPYLAVELGLDPGVIAGLLLEMPEAPPHPAPALATAEAAAGVLEAVARLLRLLASPADIPILGPQLERELCYRLLQGPAGGTLREVVQGRKHFSQIRTAGG
ncbi:AraC family transcriptional regulator [Methylobacterium oryzisoli]|uniref:AraC family transcriptional regulator n=1 Tax=Methylobacterium oryzisoli TaxID=3385502 RepID=UPI0038917ADE